MHRLGLRTETESDRAPQVPEQDRHAGRVGSAARLAGGEDARARRHPGAHQRRADRRLRSALEGARRRRRQDGQAGNRARRSGAANATSPCRTCIRSRRTEFLEFGDGVVHNLSWQQARHINVPIRGVYVANPGYILGAAGVPRGAVITEVGGKEIAGLADFEQVVGELHDGQRAPVRFFTLDDPNNAQVRVMRMDRRWFPARACNRDDVSGTWPCKALGGERRRSAAQAGDHELREDRRSDRQQARAVAGAGQFRHAVLRLRHHRAQLLRHRPDRRCRARAGARRSQHRAVAARRRAPDVLGDDRDPGPRRIRASAAQPRGRFLRPDAHRHDAGAFRDAACRRAAARRAGVGGRRAAGRQSAIALGDRRIDRSGRVSAVAHAAVPRRQSGDHRADQRPGRLRRRAGQQERRGGRELGELRLRSRAARSCRRIAAFRRTC